MELSESYNLAMTIDNKTFLGLWTLEDLPACDQGMEFARTFLTSCGEGVDRVGVEEPADRMAQINAAYTAFVEHVGDCDNCNEK